MSQFDVSALPRWVGYVALALVILGNAAGNILLKIGANAAKSNKLLFGLLPWQTLAGIACFAFGVLIYSWALGRIELHVAQIILSLQYVLVIGLAAAFLGEAISMQAWFGIGFIALGLLLCSR